MERLEVLPHHEPKNRRRARLQAQRSRGRQLRAVVHRLVERSSWRDGSALRDRMKYASWLDVDRVGLLMDQITILTSFGARVITFLMVAPASSLMMASLAIANLSNSSSEISGETSTRSLILPLIWRMAVTFSAETKAGSMAGQPARAIDGR